LDSVEEIPGQGIIAKYQGHLYKLGSTEFTDAVQEKDISTKVFMAEDGKILGKFVFEANYRPGLKQLFEKLQNHYDLYILSGDNDSEKPVLEKILPKNVSYRFNQSVHDKMDFIQNLQKQGKKVMMIGDGLNDAGALQQADTGIAVSEDTNVFTPSSDGILKGSRLIQLAEFLKISKQTKKIIYISFIIAFLYNIIGLSFAVTNNLTPIVAAILMPISSISIVIFVTFVTNIISKKLKNKRINK
jgi:Cu+-exporting ATPase